MRMIDDCRYHLVQLGISMSDADQLRRIAMTLHRWHEMECGDGNDYGSWCITRGKKDSRGAFEYDDAGKPYMEYHSHTSNGAKYTRIADRENGAKRRLTRIMANYPQLTYYIQGDPRGASLYIIPKTGLFASDPSPEYLEANYTRGVAVYK